MKVKNEQKTRVRYGVNMLNDELNLTREKSDGVIATVERKSSVRNFRKLSGKTNK